MHHRVFTVQLREKQLFSCSTVHLEHDMIYENILKGDKVVCENASKGTEKKGCGRHGGGCFSRGAHCVYV